MKFYLKIVLLCLLCCGAGCTNSSPHPQPLLAPQASVVPKVSPSASPVQSEKSNTALVISRHANLRTEDNASATVIRTVPQDAVVEVIKQQGAWFYVKTETETGWLHGNTLKLQSFEIASQPTVKRTSPLPAPSAVETVADLKIKGNRNSMIYHMPNCASYNEITERNIVWFKTEAEAESAGYRRAKNCSGGYSVAPSYNPTPTKVSVPAPKTDASSSGASARCRDGSLSYSAHRRGTCSHHGGVAEWY